MYDARIVGVRQHISYQRARCGNELVHGASALPSRPDWSCDCVAFTTKNGKCSKRRGCDPAKFDGSKKTDVYVRPGATREGYAPSYAPTYRPTSND